MNPADFDHNKFQRELANLLDKYESSGLDRAWEIAKRYMKVVGEVDKRDDETLASSIRHAWFDLWLMFKGEDATFTYWGIYEEMRHGVGDRADELDADVIAIGESCMKGSKPARKRRKAAPQKGPRLRDTAHPHLKVVQ